MNNLFLKLTNANPLNRSMPLAIRKDLVLTVHSNMAVREDSSIEMVTYVLDLHTVLGKYWKPTNT